MLIIFNKNWKLMFENMGLGDWGLGFGDWGVGPIPNRQSPIPNPQSPLIKEIKRISIFII